VWSNCVFTILLIYDFVFYFCLVFSLRTSIVEVPSDMCCDPAVHTYDNFFILNNTCISLCLKRELFVSMYACCASGMSTPRFGTLFMMY